MRNLTYDTGSVSALFTPFLEGVSERSERGGCGLQPESGFRIFQTNLPEVRFLLLMV